MKMKLEETDALVREEQRIQEFLRHDPQNIHLLERMVELKLALKQLAPAHIWAQRALAAHPDSLALRFHMTSIAIAQERYADAEALLRALLEAAPDEPAITYDLASVCMAQGRHEDGLAVLERFPGLDQRLPASRVLKARCLHQLGQLEAARDALGTPPADGASDSDAVGLCALLELDLGNGEQAARLAAKALDADPGNLAALVTAATMALAGPQLDVATDLYNRALRLAPNDGRSWLGLAMVAMYHQDFALATVRLQKAVDAMPGHPGSWVALGWAQIFQRDLAGAHASFAAAHEVSRNFAESHAGLAVVAAMQGQVEQAQRSARRALRLDPDNVSARFALALAAGEVSDQASFDALVDRLLPALRDKTVVPGTTTIH